MQQQISPFFQCQEYVAELSKPVSLIEFTKENMQNQLPTKLQSNSHNMLSDHKHKKSLQDDKINPYNSNWANVLLNKHYKVQVRCDASKWVIKRVAEDESMISNLPNLNKPIQGQRKLFSNTVSKQIKQRLNKFNVDQHRQYTLTPKELHPYQNSSLSHLNTNPNNHNSDNNKKKYNNDIHNNNNIINIRLNSESPKQMPIFDINFIKKLEQFIV